MVLSHSGPPTPDSLWRATAIPLAAQPALQGNHSTRVLVIGAGFTGCSTALHLAAQGIDVSVIDAGQPGIGGSGRNGGQVNPGIKKTVEEVQEVWGKELGSELYRIIGSAPDLVFDLIKKHQIECHPVRTGIIQPAYSQKSMDYLKGYADYQHSIGAPIEILDQQETARLIGSGFYTGSFLDKRAGSVQPLSYCRGLAQAAITAGARFFGDTPAIRIDPGSGEKVVHTKQGSIRAEFVFLCTNGYTNLVPEDPLIQKLSKSVIPFYSYKVATRPLPPELQATVIPEQQVIADTRRLLTYFRKDHMGRLVMGGAGGPYEAKSKESYKNIQARIHELYPQIRKPEIEFRWCGKVCLTMDGVPHVHELSPGIFAGLGYNGRGVAMASMMGKWLAALVTAEQPETTVIPMTGVKSIPFHGMRKPFIQAMLHVNNIQDRMER